MLHIYCPWCGEHRAEEEFHAKGPAHLERPAQPESCSDAQWGDYLFFRENPRGIYHELWVHSAGCRKFFNMTRHTVSYEILETYRVGEQPTVTSGADVVVLHPEKSREEGTTLRVPEGERA